jgi:hypothetical protein
MIGSRTPGGIVNVVVSTGGTGYTAPPAITVSGGGGTGAVLQAQVSDSRVSSVVVVNAGTGYTSNPSISFSTGSAAATAYAYTGTLRPMKFFKGRYNDLYGVDGMGRGIRWDGDSASVERLGIQKPAAGPAVTASSTSNLGYISAVQMVANGAGYNAVPAVAFSGGSATSPATAVASIAGGRVTGVKVTSGGVGYQTTPTVTFTGGIATGASLSVGVIGQVNEALLTSSGAGYTTLAACTGNTTGVITCKNHGVSAGSTVSFQSLSGGAGLSPSITYYAVSVGANTLTVSTDSATTASPVALTTALTYGRMNIPPARVQFSSAQGLTDAAAYVVIGDGGAVTSISLVSAGTGATTSGVTASLVGGNGSGAVVKVTMKYAVSTVTAVSGGTGFYTEPVVTFRAASRDALGRGAAATASVTNGSISAVSVISGGEYYAIPSAVILDSSARATATVNPSLRGKYKCAIRYIDDTPEDANGPIPSSISDLVEVDTSNGASDLTWSFTHYNLDDRVYAMELWRTSADQSVALYRVKRILRTDPEFSTSYVDNMSEKDLQDSTREGFALMPVTLPSGQVNARRFEVAPGNFAEACMFQDRAWFAVDVTGRRPNSLLFSEIDEPESVPPENELVLQENAETPDKIVALVPLGGQLLIIQQAHLYRLNYVAQPIIDASLMLGGYRGIINSRCWDVMGGVAFIADSNGLYAYDGNQEEAISVPVDDYWREKKIDFSKSDQFHVRADVQTKVVRFYFCKSSDTAPVRALCYCVSTKAWWEEQYASAITATCKAVLGSQYVNAYGTAGGSVLKSGGLTDNGTAISYDFQTGNQTIVDEPSRAMSVVYQPTDSSCLLNLRVHYNNSPTSRPNAITNDRGSLFVATTAGAQLDMHRQLSLAEANGFARAYHAGRKDDRSVGGDRHLAVGMSGTQSSDAVTVYTLQVDGVQ